MGWKLSGLAIDKDFSQNPERLLALLNINNFILVRESTFEEETADYYENEAIGVTFFEKGSFLSAGFNLITDSDLLTKASLNQRIIAFYINDTTSTYCFDFYSDGKYIRSKWFSSSDPGIDTSTNFGELLEEEKQETDELEIIFNLIGAIIGKRFYDIEEEASMLGYKILPNKKGVGTGPKSFWKRLFNI